MKKILLVFLLLTAVMFAKSIEDCLITVNLDKSGNAHVIEEYTISFSNTGEVSEFNSLAGVNELSAWKGFSDAIEPTFFGEKQDLHIVSKKDSLGFGKVLLEYMMYGFAKESNGSGRFTVRSMMPNQTVFYNSESGVLTVPPKTTIQFVVELPKAELIEVDKYVTASPTALFLGPYADQKAGKVTYIIRGPASAPDFIFSYTIEKGIGEFDIQKIADTVYSWAFTNPIYTLVILTIIVLAAVYRREITGLVTESFAGEEDIELPKKEL